MDTSKFPTPNLALVALWKGEVGYIDINSFKANTDELFIEAVDYVIENGAKAIIYDVRSNGGGYLDTVVNMLDYIANDGTTLASFSNDYDKPEKAKDGHSLSIPTVILCKPQRNSSSLNDLTSKRLITLFSVLRSHIKKK